MLTIKKHRHINKRLNKREYKYFLMFAGISIIGFILFYLYPMIRTILLSFTDTELFSDFHFVGFANYIHAFSGDDLFWLSISKSLIFGLSSGVLVLVTSLIMALLLNQSIKFIGVFRVIFFLPFIIPSFAVGAVYKNLFEPNIGVINTLLRFIGVDNPPGWYTTADTALLTMILISAFGFGLKMIIFLAALQNVNRNYYEVAKIEGANSWQTFWRITFPIISPIVFFNIIMITIDGLKSFNLAFVLGNGNGYPANSTLLFPVYLFQSAFNFPWRLGYASSMAWIFFVIILILTFANFLLSKMYVKEDVV